MSTYTETKPVIFALFRNVCKSVKLVKNKANMSIYSFARSFIHCWVLLLLAMSKERHGHSGLLQRIVDCDYSPPTVHVVIWPEWTQVKSEREAPNGKVYLYSHDETLSFFRKSETILSLLFLLYKCFFKSLGCPINVGAQWRWAKGKVRLPPGTSHHNVLAIVAQLKMKAQTSDDEEMLLLSAQHRMPKKCAPRALGLSTNA